MLSYAKNLVETVVYTSIAALPGFEAAAYVSNYEGDGILVPAIVGVAGVAVTGLFAKYFKKTMDVREELEIERQRAKGDKLADIVDKDQPSLKIVA